MGTASAIKPRAKRRQAVVGIYEAEQNVGAETRDCRPEKKLAGLQFQTRLVDEVLERTGPGQAHEKPLNLRDVAIELVADELEVKRNFTAALCLADRLHAATDHFLAAIAAAGNHPDSASDDGND